MQTKPVIIFDLDGTLVFYTPRMIDEFNRLAALLAPAPILPEFIRESERWNHYYWMPSPEFLEDLHPSGGIRDQKFWLRYTPRHLEVLGLPPSIAQEIATPLVERLMIFLQSVQRREYFDADAAATIKKLSSAGYRIGLLTNRDHMFPPVALDGLDQHFEVIVSAGDVGYWKPDPRIFQITLERLQVNPQSSIYVGDNYYSDVLGACAAGVQPVLVDRNGLFPEARCPVITSLPDLFKILEYGHFLD